MCLRRKDAFTPPTNGYKGDSVFATQQHGLVTFKAVGKPLPQEIDLLADSITF